MILWDSLLPLKLGFDVVDIFTRLYNQSIFPAIRLSHINFEGLHVESSSIRNAVAVDCFTIIELLSIVGETLVFGRNSRLVFDLFLDISNPVS